jgi:hypothetical protein
VSSELLVLSHLPAQLLGELLVLSHLPRPGGIVCLLAGNRARYRYWRPLRRRDQPLSGHAEEYLDCRLDIAVAATEDGLQRIPIHVWKHGEKN